MAEGLGEGYSTITLAGGMIFTMGTADGREVVLALNPRNGQRVWASPTGGGVFGNNQGNGPRSTPTIDGNRLYALGAYGDLVCLETESGKLVWRKNILRDFQAENIRWGICESVLIDGDRLICTPGGPNAALVALDKTNGNVVWTAAVPGNPQAAYSSAIAADVAGARQYINFVSTGVVGVRAEDGAFLWGESSSANGTANISTPVVWADSVFSASGYGTGGALVQLSQSGGEVVARRAYHTKEMKNHHGGIIALDGYVYGSNDPGVLTCLDLKDGRVMWKDRSVGKAAIAYADGHLYVRSEAGPFALVEATPEGYREKGRMEQPHRSGWQAWAHPVVAGGRLYLRDMDKLLVYDVAAE
jgi:outer membrane protein assembly factor BamB